MDVGEVVDVSVCVGVADNVSGVDEEPLLTDETSVDLHPDSPKNNRSKVKHNPLQKWIDEFFCFLVMIFSLRKNYLKTCYI